jgi:hypothetical protein
MCTNWRSLLPYKKNANKKTSWSHARKIAAPTGPMCTNWRSLLPVTMLTITLRRMQTNAGKSETDRLWQNSDKKENKVSTLRMQTNAGNLNPTSIDCWRNPDIQSQRPSTFAR